MLAGDRSMAEAWNFGPDAGSARTVRELAETFLHTWPSARLELDLADQPHEADRLSLDCAKATTRLGWRPVWGFERSVQSTADWYRAHHERAPLRTSADLDAYISDARRAGHAWAVT